MTLRTIVVLAFTLVGLTVAVACGPKCPEVLSKKTPDVMARDDALRVNAYVEARKAAIAEAKEGNALDVEKAQFTVTACELAIQIQMRIIALAEEGGALYDDNLKELNDTRCFLDEILEKRGKVVGLKIGKGVYIKQGKGQEIQDTHAAMEEKYGKIGRPRQRELEDVYEKGMEPPKTGKKKGEEAEESEGAGDKPDEAGDDDVVGEGVEGGEEGGEEGEQDEESGGAMDAF
jgi:hypothetical protein